jgi:hypothetical protein
MPTTLLYAFRGTSWEPTSFKWSVELSQKLNGKLMVLPIYFHDEKPKEETSVEVLKTKQSCIQVYGQPSSGQYRLLSDLVGVLYVKPGGNLFSQMFPQVKWSHNKIMIVTPGLIDTEEETALEATTKKIIRLPHTIERISGFYTILEQSTLFNLPKSFFYNLSKDITLSQYLISVFGKH